MLSSANSSADQDISNDTAKVNSPSANNSSSISLDQYNHLLSLINNQQNSSVAQSSDSHALLAGNICLMTTSTLS